MGITGREPNWTGCPMGGPVSFYLHEAYAETALFQYSGFRTEKWRRLRLAFGGGLPVMLLKNMVDLRHDGLQLIEVPLKLGTHQ